ncbi:MAG: DNA ligase D [Gammaproteobacteria bacterium]|nr:DNA ligase D [Gammaproteobacteria bacterium]
MPSSRDNLETYRRKRSASATPEPFGAETGRAAASDAPRRLFVVQQHAARRMHWDFRLEVNNVLCSWAVPKGPSMDPDDKRFAAEVEDHPLDYADFEGSIPDGNYGAGSVIVWDTGTYIELEDFVTGFQDGKLLFELHGHKLRGRFTLIRLKGRETSGKEWLLIKERDQWVREEPLADSSVLSGMTIETIAAPTAIEDGLVERIKAIEPRPPATVSLTESPMLAKSSEPFHREGWVYEIKYDGYRLMIERDGDRVTLHSRTGIDLTTRFPEIAKSAAKLPYTEFTIDSEVVVHDDRGVPSFSRLQQRAAVRGELATRTASMHDPVTCYAFDLLHACGYDLKALPLTERKALLREMLPAAGPIRYSEHIDGNGIETFHAMRRLGLEGVVGKRADSAYVSGRSESWRKVRGAQTGDFVIAGWVPVKNNPDDIGALALGEYRGDELTYCGRVGSGLGTDPRRELQARLAALKAAPGLPNDIDDRAHRWVEPVLVCEVQFREYSADGLLRHPVFLRLRDDKAVSECISTYREPPPDALEQEPEREVVITNPDKVFFPEKLMTKGDLLGYYEAVAPWMLPYLVDRPLVLTRFPDGIHGKSFYQRDAPAFVPDWVERKVLWSESAEREVHYFIAQNTESLVYLANMGAIPIHAWHSRITNLEHPDWCVLDLDPKQAPFADVVETATEVKNLLDEIELPGFLKTSGASGLHILLPLARQLTHRQATTLGELLARVLVARRPDICTITRTVRKRDNKVYIDYLQNGHGQLLVAPFSARAEPAASVSMPVTWDALNGELNNANYDLKNAVPHLHNAGDPMADVLTIEPDLGHALARLGGLLG